MDDHRIAAFGKTCIGRSSLEAETFRFFFGLASFELNPSSDFYLSRNKHVLLSVPHIRIRRHLSNPPYIGRERRTNKKSRSSEIC
jgi:hypothetical protein